MVRLLRILSVWALLAAGGILLLTVSPWRRGDSAVDEIRRRPSAIEVFNKESGNRSGECSEQRPPLIVQAEALAQYLNPPKGPEKPLPPVSTAKAVSAPVLPRIRPPAPAANFKLRATSYYPNQPGKSMALIAETGSAEGSERWVKEGSQVGHFVIQEIRRGSIMYRDGSQVREMGVEHVTGLPRLVRDVTPGLRQVSAAVGGGNVLSSASIDTNSIEVGRN